MKPACTFFLSFLVATVAIGQSRPGGDALMRDQIGFGSAAVISEGHVLISEPANDYTTGYVYVYEATDGEWKETVRLAAPDGQWSDNFGAALDVDANLLAVGATSQRDGKGAIYLYGRDEAGAWKYQSTLTTDAPSLKLGRSIDVEGDWLVAGSAGDTKAPGAAIMYRRADDGSWVESAVLRADSARAMTGYASQVLMAGNRVLVAAPQEGAGVVYVFRFDDSTNEWLEDEPLFASDGHSGDRFGSALASHDGQLLVGAPGVDRRTGAVYLYSFDEETAVWNQTAKLAPFDTPSRASFGSAVGFRGDELWVGAPLSSRYRGSIYINERDGAEFMSVRKLLLPDADRGDLFGGSFAVGPSLAVVGIRGADFGFGNAAIFSLDETGWSLQARLAGENSTLKPITGEKVTCEEGKANIFSCSNVDLISLLPVSDMGGRRGVRVNDMWGWEDPATGREYALVGRVDGTSFVDVTDPYHPKYLGDLPRTKGTPASVWRDIKVYKDHAYIVADGAGEHGIQIFDLTQLRDVQNAPVTFEETARYTKINSAHNIVINESTGFGYAVGNSGGGETCGGGLHMLDLSNPVAPEFAGCFADATTGRRNTGYSHDAQCVIYSGPDVDYSGHEICFGSNETAISIADVTDKDAPVAVAAAKYPNVAYTHQGWLTEDHRYFLVNDEGDEPSGLVEGTRTLIWDVQDLDDPQLIAEYIADNPATDHNLYIKGNLVYESNYRAGLRILDISDITKPVEVGYFDTVPFGDDKSGGGGSWSNYPFFKNGTIAVTSAYEGLFLLKRKDEEL
ncbi:MAG: choice-of-anchor B family protein [Rhodothermales bacterium]|nr:choice-of-anchor B family protein [Rhodothermales bacterium]